MATDLSREQLRRLARLGAERRLEELRQEDAAIRAAFPELDERGGSRAGRRGRRPGKAATGAGSPASGTSAKRQPRKAAKRRRTPMSAAQKKAVSERMKKYWATRRKASE